MIFLRKTARVATRWLAVSVCGSLLLGGCAGQGEWLSRSGPNVKDVQAATAPDTANANGMQLVQVTDTVARKLLEARKQSLFSGVFASSVQPGYVVGAGDVVEISVWEAPPATLFGSASTDARVGPSTTRVTSFPEQMVNSDGMVNMPFVGQVRAAGRNPQQIEADIARLLKGKANQAQVLVRVIRNATSNVTVVGEVTTSLRMPITAKGERLLDALAAAGGTRQPVNKMTLQMTRGNLVQALPLETIIRDPKQNIMLQPGDVVTALYQPLSYVVLGATGKNEEISFEAQGISLSQALARAGGLKDERADARGVFIFRLEEPTALDWPQPVATTPDGKVPVIYQLDLNDPASFFVAQSFSVNNKDVLYVSNAPAAELQKFLNIVGSVLGPVIGVRAATR